MSQSTDKHIDHLIYNAQRPQNFVRIIFLKKINKLAKQKLEVLGVFGAPGASQQYTQIPLP
jgi:hypothetical protein